MKEIKMKLIILTIMKKSNQIFIFFEFIIFYIIIAFDLNVIQIYIKND